MVKEKLTLVQKRLNPSIGKSSSRIMKPSRRGNNTTPPLSIDDILNDIVHNGNYNTISYIYSLMIKKE